ncbi:MAG: hypothetical protein AB7S41_06515 [Parvibaculaceae bacterium]
MAYPTLEVAGRTIIVLQSLEDGDGRDERRENEAFGAVREAARRHPDAVAFGYFDGTWVPAA